MVFDVSAFGQDGRDQQVFRTSIGRALIDIQVLLSNPACGDCQSRLANPRGSDQSRSQRQVALVDNKPAGQKLPQDFALADPFPFRRIGLAHRGATWSVSHRL